MPCSLKLSLELTYLSSQERWGSLVMLMIDIEASHGPKGEHFYEGDFKFWLNGASTPKMHGTGTEDFFNSAHGYVKIVSMLR